MLTKIFAAKRRLIFFYLFSIFLTSVLAPSRTLALDFTGSWLIEMEINGVRSSEIWIVTNHNLPGNGFVGIVTRTDGTKFGELAGNSSADYISLTTFDSDSDEDFASYFGMVSNDGTTVSGRWPTVPGPGYFNGTRTNSLKRLSGKVSNREKSGVKGITIELAGRNIFNADVSKTTLTDANGYYSFDVESGVYTLIASGEGDYIEDGISKKENGGVLSLEANFGGHCPGTADGSKCTGIEVNNSQVSVDFVYTLCGSSERMPNGKPQTHCPLVFVPGFLGSKIACNAGTRELWPNVLQSVIEPAPRWKEMYLLADGETNDPTGGDCSATAQPQIGVNGVLSTVAGADIYSSAMKSFDEIFPGRWWGSPYDWRKSPVLGATRLESVVNDALEATGSKYVVLYGHSMGGLVIREFINDPSHENKVARVLTAGTPYWGAPKAHFSLLGGYIDTPLGTELGWMSWKSQVQKMARNLQGIFFLYPSARFGSWLGLSRSSSSPLVTQDASGEDAWVKELGSNPDLLRKAREWHARNDGFPNTPIQYRAVIGSGVGTTINVDVLLPKNGFTVAGVSVGNGDGTVPLLSASQGASRDGTPLTFGKSVPLNYYCGVGHVDLPGAPAVVQSTRRYLTGGEDINGFQTPCSYKGSAFYTAGIPLGGKDFFYTVYNEGPPLPSKRGTRRASTTALTLNEARSQGLVQAFFAGETYVVLTNDLNPVTIQINGKNFGFSTQRISDFGNGRIQSFYVTKGPVTVDSSSSVTTVTNKILKPINLVKKAPKTTAKITAANNNTSKITLTAKGPNGIGAISYRTSSSGERIRYKKPFKIATKKLKQITVSANDPFGNQEKWKKIAR